MEKRVLLAAFLSGVVLLVWFAFVAPQGKRGPAVVPTPTGTHAASGTAMPSPAPEEKPEQPQEEASSGPVEPATKGTAARQVTLENRDFRVEVDSAGGVVRSLVLKQYKDDEGKPLELVSGEGIFPLAMGATGPWNSEPYEVKESDHSLTLRWSDGKGSWVEKRIGLGKGRYGLDVHVRAGGPAGRGGVVIAGTRPEQGAKGSQTRFARFDAVVRVNGSMSRVNPAKVEDRKMFAGSVEFAGVEDQYFLKVLLPDKDVNEVGVVREEGGQTPRAMVVAFARGDEVAGTMYAGPKAHHILVAYGRGLDETLSFGIFGVLSVAFLAALRWIYTWTANWGVAIVVLTAAIRVVLFPLTHKSTVAMRRMQKVQPKMKAIQERYKEKAKKDPQVRQRMNQEIMGLYKQEGVNPMGGCLPTLVQLPILWALYTLFAYAIELRQAPFILWIHDLSLKDPTYVLPILMTVSMFAQQKLAPQTGDPAQRRMFLMMPLIFGFMFMSFPAGLVLYWLVNNLLTIGQQLVTEHLLRRSERPA